MKLRDQLLSALSELSGTRTFHLHVLVSSPRKYTGLFPYATTRHRVYAQDILILCSEQAGTPALAGAPTTKLGLPNIDVPNVREPVTITENSGASANLVSNASRSSPGYVPQPEPRVLTSAIEASLYTIPSTGSLILYIAKVDSTGQGSRSAGSPTRTLVRALILHYLDPSTRPRAAGNHKIRRVWLHLFARAQAQYLFPNSAEHPAKKALGDVQLCRWWQTLIAGVVNELAEKRRRRANSTKDEWERVNGSRPTVESEPLRVYFVLPGMNELEAVQTLGGVATVPAPDEDVQWVYGHPYGQEDVPLPYITASRTARWGESSVPNLGQLIPSFDDDPKSRFLVEIAHTTKVDGVMSPSRQKRRRTSDGGSAASGLLEGKQKEKDSEIAWRPSGELGIVSANDFWERMSFRQECVAGAITGFFVVACAWPAESASATSTATADTGIAEPGEVSYQLVRRVVISLMTGVEFSTTDRTVKATEILESSIRSLCTPGTAAATASNSTIVFGAKDTAAAGDVVTEGTSTMIGTPGSAGTDDAAGAMPYSTPRTPPPAATRARHVEDDGAEAEDAAGTADSAVMLASDTYEGYVYGIVTVDRPVATLTMAKPQGGTGATPPSSLSDDVRVLMVKRKEKGGNVKR